MLIHSLWRKTGKRVFRSSQNFLERRRFPSIFEGCLSAENAGNSIMSAINQGVPFCAARMAAG